MSVLFAEILSRLLYNKQCMSIGSLLNSCWSQWEVLVKNGYSKSIYQYTNTMGYLGVFKFIWRFTDITERNCLHRRALKEPWGKATVSFCFTRIICYVLKILTRRQYGNQPKTRMRKKNRKTFHVQTNCLRVSEEC